MKSCKDKIRLLTLCGVCFAVGALLSLILPPYAMITVQSAVICAFGIIFIINGGRT